MDMTPPQAPPAVVSNAQQAAIDTVGRLAAVNDWLLEQRDELPAFPPPVGDMGKDDYLAALAAYWQSPVTGEPGMPATPRRAAFATHLAALMRDEASLRGHDGTLTEADAALAAAFARSRGELTPPGARALELTVGGAAYAAALILESDSGRALLFMPGRGWEAFASLDELHSETEERYRTALAGRQELPGLMRDALSLASADPLVSSRDVGPHPFEALTARVIELQQQKVTAAWNAFTDEDLDEQGLVDRLAQIVQPDANLDVVGVLAHRDVLLQEQLDSERLAPLPRDVRSEWQDALSAWRITLNAVAQLRDEAGLTDRSPLQQFALDSLSTRLSALGIQDDPAALRVQVTPDPIDPLKRWFHGAQPSETSLVDLALQNVGAIPNESYRLLRGDGTVVSLDSAAIRLLVRSADIGASYIGYLNGSFDASSETGRLHRELSAQLQRARMRFELADARAASFITSEPRGLYTDHAERGYHWVSAALDSPVPKGRRQVERYDVIVNQLTYRGAPFTDVLLFGVRNRGGVFRVVLYTPDAPDGRTFREYDDRAHAARDFLLNPAFETYLLDRLPASFTHRSANGSRHFKRDDAAKRANWVLGQGNPPEQTQLDEPIDEREIGGDFLEALYDTSLHKVTADVLAASRATDFADWETCAGLLFRGLSNPLGDLAATIATDVIRSVPRAFQASWRAYDNIKAGDYGQAFVNLTETYTSALNLAGLVTSQPMRGVGAVVRSGYGSRALIATRKHIAPPAAVFETRFRASGVSPAQVVPSRDGISRIAGKTYVEQGGQLYHVRFDAATDGWRLTRPGALDANLSGPAISRSPLGVWSVRNDIGLLGGMHPARVAMRASRASRLREAARIDARGARMTTEQLFEAHRELFRRHGIRRAHQIVDDAIAQARAPAGMDLMSPTDRAIWNEAIEVGLGRRQATIASAERRVEALRVLSGAGDAPRPGPSAPRPALSAPAAADLIPPSSAVELSPEAWPMWVWHYVRPWQLPPGTSSYVTFQQSVQRGTGVRGIPVTTTPPYAPAPVLQGLPSATANTLASPLGERAGAWVRMTLARPRPGAPSHVRVFRSLEDNGRSEYFLRPTALPHDPNATRPLLFGPGNFETGRWAPPPF
jgi:hypothetical protein